MLPRNIDPLGAAGLRVGTCMDAGRYIGVLRRGRTVVIECGHRHANRANDTKFGGMSAGTCISRIVRAAQDPEFARQEAIRLARGEVSFGGDHASRLKSFVNDAARKRSPEEIAAFRERVAQVAELLAAGRST